MLQKKIFIVFFEVAQDLSIKGLCENHFESNAEDPLQYSDHNNHPNTKRKKTRNTNDVIDVGAIVNETDTKTIFNKVTSKVDANKKKQNFSTVVENYR